MVSALNLPEIKDQLSSNDLFEAFKKQLAKDFRQSNTPDEFVESLAQSYSSIQNALVKELRQNESKPDFNLMNLLYRIDISEAQLKRYLSDNQSENYFQILAELIIKRVLQKVVIKEYYRKNG